MRKVRPKWCNLAQPPSPPFSLGRPVPSALAPTQTIPHQSHTQPAAAPTSSCSRRRAMAASISLTRTRLLFSSAWRTAREEFLSFLYHFRRSAGSTSTCVHVHVREVTVHKQGTCLYQGPVACGQTASQSCWGDTSCACNCRPAPTPQPSLIMNVQNPTGMPAPLLRLTPHANKPPQHLKARSTTPTWFSQELLRRSDLSSSSAKRANCSRRPFTRVYTSLLSARRVR